ncbi:MoaD/ThiS family protein, partial [Pseudomonas aeruginosa]
MIRVQYFARYREALGIDGEQLHWDAGLATLGGLRQLLVERGGAGARTL